MKFKFKTQQTRDMPAVYVWTGMWAGQDNLPLSIFSPAIFIEIAPSGAVMIIARTARVRIISPAGAPMARGTDPIAA